MSSLNNTAATAPTKINDPISLKFPYYYHYSPIDSVYRWHDKQYGYSQPTYRYEPGFGSDAIGFGSYTRDKAWPKTTLSFGEGNIADAVGLGAALEYVERIGIHNIARYEHDLLEYGQHALSSVKGLRPIGTAKNKASVMSFVLDGYSTEQVGKTLNQHGIAVRSGHHCAQPILRRFGVEQTVRPSLAFYNTTEEIDLLVSVLHQLSRNKRTV